MGVGAKQASVFAAWSRVPLASRDPEPSCADEIYLSKSLNICVKIAQVDFFKLHGMEWHGARSRLPVAILNWIVPLGSNIFVQTAKYLCQKFICSNYKNIFEIWSRVPLASRDPEESRAEHSDEIFLCVKIAHFSLSSCMAWHGCQSGSQTESCWNTQMKYICPNC